MTHLLTRGQLAREGRVNLATIRYYERRGLLRHRGRSPGGYHQYDQASVRRLRFINRAQELGFTLREIDELLELRLDSTTVCHDVEQRTRAKLTDMQQKIRDLQRMKRAPEQLAAACEHETALNIARFSRVWAMRLRMRGRGYE